MSDKPTPGKLFLAGGILIMMPFLILLCVVAGGFFWFVMDMMAGPIVATILTILFPLFIIKLCYT